MDVFRPLRQAIMASDMRVSINDEFNYRTIFKRNISICKFFDFPRREIILYAFYQEMQSRGHWPNKCPIEPVIFVILSFIDQINLNKYEFPQGHYGANNMTIFPEMLPPVGPDLFFKIRATFSIYATKPIKLVESLVVGRLEKPKN